MAEWEPSDDWTPCDGGLWKARFGRCAVVVFEWRPRDYEGPRIWEWRTGRFFGEHRRGHAPTMQAAMVHGERAARGKQ